MTNDKTNEAVKHLCESFKAAAMSVDDVGEFLTDPEFEKITSAIRELVISPYYILGKLINSNEVTNND